MSAHSADGHADHSPHEEALSPEVAPDPRRPVAHSAPEISAAAASRPTPAPEPCQAGQVAPPPQKSGVQMIALVTLVAVNAALGAGIMALRHDEKEARIPIAAMATDVTELKTKAGEVTTHIEQTRQRLDKQESRLTHAMEKLDSHEEHEREAAKKAKERADHEDKELSALVDRVSRVERRPDRGDRDRGNTYTVEEVVKIMNLEDDSHALPHGVHAVAEHAPVAHAEHAPAAHVEHEEHAAPPKHEEHAAPAKHGEHAAPTKHEEHAAPAKHEEHAAPPKHEEHAAPAKHEEHAAPPKHEEHASDEHGHH